tara:strand:- start:4634 stop:4753 length:120 start_codon:yes stop_codon:yes gene_type:complete
MMKETMIVQIENWIKAHENIDFKKAVILHGNGHWVKVGD